MLKPRYFLLMIASLLSLVAFAQAESKTVTVDLNQTEIQAMVGIFNRLGVKGAPFNDVCYGSSAEVQTTTHGMSPAKWKLKYNNDQESDLLPAEIQVMVKIFNRAEIKGSFDGVNYRAKATISESSCAMSPAHWTISFQTE